MKSIREMDSSELAAFVQSHLRERGINVVLSGGASVTFYSQAKYVSKDLDLINVQFAKRSKIKAAMSEMGFKESGRYFKHTDTRFFIEFPDGPLSAGEEPIKDIKDMVLETGTLRIISPTDCVKDRLCAYYFWGDKQGLVQAKLVAEVQSVDIVEIERWSKAEGKLKEYEDFMSLLG